MVNAKLKVAALGLFSGILVISFQNCSKALEAPQDSYSAASVDAPGTLNPPPTPTPTPAPNPPPVPTPSPLAGQVKCRGIASPFICFTKTPEVKIRDLELEAIAYAKLNPNFLAPDKRIWCHVNIDQAANPGEAGYPIEWKCHYIPDNQPERVAWNLPTGFRTLHLNSPHRCTTVPDVLGTEPVKGARICNLDDFKDGADAADECRENNTLGNLRYDTVINGLSRIRGGVKVLICTYRWPTCITGCDSGP